MNRVDQRALQGQWFGTMTIPDVDKPTFASLEHARRKWADSFRRRFPDIAVHWFKERGDKGFLPHLHFVMHLPKSGDVPTLQEFRAWNDKAWARSVKSQHPRHEAVGCQVKPVESSRKIARYCGGLAGYVTKSSDDEAPVEHEETGGTWNIINRHALPVSIRTVEVSEAEAKKVLRVARKLAERQAEIWFIWNPERDDQDKIHLVLRRLRPRAVKSWNTRKIVKWENVQDQVNDARRTRAMFLNVCPEIGFGSTAKAWLVKRVRRRFISRPALLQEWHEDQGTRRLEPGEQYRHSFSAGSFEHDATTWRKLVDWIIAARPPHDGIPF